MQTFVASAEQMNISQILFTGASYGIVTVVGASWKDLVESVVDFLFPDPDLPLTNQLIVTVCISVFGAGVIWATLAIRRCLGAQARRITSRPYVPS